jgi:hypothetical protein
MGQIVTDINFKITHIRDKLSLIEIQNNYHIIEVLTNKNFKITILYGTNYNI